MTSEFNLRFTDRRSIARSSLYSDRISFAPSARNLLEPTEAALKPVREERSEAFRPDEVKESSPSKSTSTNRTAVLLLDFQNEFVKKGGKLHAGVSDVMKATGVLEKVPKLVDLARKMNAIIIYSPVVMRGSEVFRPIGGGGDDDDEMAIIEEGAVAVAATESLRRLENFTELSGLFTENTWNCEIAHEVEPRNDDVVLTDRSDFSAFAGTKLLSHLRENNVKHFFVTGFLTDVCVYQTTMDAADLLPEMTTYVVSDGCAAKSLRDHDDALEKLGRESARVVSSSEAETVLVESNESMKQAILDGNDEWLMIEKIFSAGGVKEGETMDHEKLLSLIGTIDFDFSDSFRDGLGDKEQVSRQDMHKILFQRKPRTTFLEKLPLLLVMIYMPFMYSISTRIPFIFVALEITKGRGHDLWVVGLVLGVYQTSRAFGNLAIVTFGGKNPFKRLQVLLILFALSGWCFLTLFGRPFEKTSPFDFRPCPGEGEGTYQPLFALFFVGLCETIVILQRSVMIETAKESPSGIIDEQVLANRFSMQYAFVSFGSMVAFIAGGWLYTTYGYYTVCDFGILVQIAHLLGAILYIFLAKNSKRSLKSDNDLDGNDLIRSVIYQFQAKSVISRYSQGIANGTETALSSESSTGLAAAAIKAKEDRVLNHSLGQIYRQFFNDEAVDDAASLEGLLASIDEAEAIASTATKRPLAMSIGKQKLSKLVLYLMKLNGNGRLTEGEFVKFWAPRIYLSVFESSQEASVTVIWPYMKAVVATQAVAALCIGIFLSTALLSYTERFGMEASQVGILLGIGESLGMVIIFVKTFASSLGDYKSNRYLIGKAIISRPLNVPAVIIFAGICSILFSVNNVAFAVVCQMLYSSVNDLSVSLMNELIGTSLPPNKFKTYQGMGQWLRRLGNMITALLGPVLFGVSKGLPFQLFGGIVIVWALILWSLMYAHAARMEASIEANGSKKKKGQKRKLTRTNITGLQEIKYNAFLDDTGLVEMFMPFLKTSGTPWHILEQHYYAMNKDRIDEKLNTWKKASVDISLMEHRIRCLSAALEVEKDQRRALEDRLYARVVKSDLSKAD